MLLHRQLVSYAPKEECSKQIPYPPAVNSGAAFHGPSHRRPLPDSTARPWVQSLCQLLSPLVLLPHCFLHDHLPTQQCGLGLPRDVTTPGCPVAAPYRPVISPWTLHACIECPELCSLLLFCFYLEFLLQALGPKVVTMLHAAQKSRISGHAFKWA